jgi:hypothetical protein
VAERIDTMCIGTSRASQIPAPHSQLAYETLKDPYLFDFLGLGDDLQSDEVLAKAAAAVRWSKYASDHAKSVGGKPWKYVLVRHDEITESKRLADFR